MTESALILVCSALAVLLVTVGGIVFGKSESKDLSGWLVNNRLMGPMLVWFLLGTEIYTAFTFEGLAGFGYVNGAAAFYNVALNDVAYAIGFLILPAFWLIGKKFNHVTQSDFIAGRYRSKGLGVFVALASALIMIAYIDLNIEGLAAIVKVVGGMPTMTANIIGFLVLTLAVFFGGIRGNAWQSMIKDVLMFVAIAALFIAVPLHYFGSFGHMYGEFIKKIPSHLVMPGVSKHLGIAWLITTVLVTGVGQWMWPQWFGVAYTARNSRTLKLQAVFMPLYQLVKVAVITIGFAAVIILGFSKSINGNNVVMMLALKTFPAWFVVLFTIAAIFSAIIPAGPIVMTSASLIVRNVYQAIRPQTSENTVYTWIRVLIFPLTFLALVLAVIAPSLIVTVLLIAYDFIAQLFPAVVVGGLFWRRATKEGVIAGILVGWIIAAALVLTKNDPYYGVNAGFYALLANLVVFFTVSIFTKPVDESYLDQFLGAAFPPDRSAKKTSLPQESGVPFGGSDGVETT